MPSFSHAKLAVKAALSSLKGKAVFSLSTIIYFVVFLVLIGDVIYIPSPLLAGSGELLVVSDWYSKLLKLRAPFVFEPIAAIYLGNLTFLFSPLNALLGFLLAALVGLNVSLAYYMLSAPACKVKGARNLYGVLGSVPGLLSGFTCCVSSIAIVLGASVAANLALVSLSPFMLPISFAALSVSILIGSSRISEQLLK